ncbi:MAG: penicillin-binding protein 2 [Clostridiales bacterium]|nr:penicillin-binding protein 2 [Clostridiales bacterium]
MGKRIDSNKSVESNIKKSLTALLIAFVFLGAYFCYALLFYGDRWFANAYNPRVSLDAWEPKVVPGDIKDRKGKLLATTIKERRKNPDTNEKQSYYYRSYSGGHKEAASLSHVVGFNNPRYGRSGVEALQIRYLMGYNNPIYERIYQKVFLSEEVGNALHLTIDTDLSKYIDSLLGSHKGSAVVMNAQTGEVLAMVSHPTFNPNNLDGGLTGDVLVNRATEGLYAPGSIFKIIVAATALDNIEDVLDYSFECHGQITIGNHSISCSEGKAHGQVDLARALEVSCNGYFAELAIRLGGEKLIKTGETFGFNQDFIFPDLKLVASRLGIKANTDDKGLALSAIGQGNVRVTPLHMAMVASAIANDGVMMEPKLVYEVVGRTGKTQKQLQPSIYRKSMGEENASIMQDILQTAVFQGTGKAAAVKGRQVAGKTGTAEILDKESNIRNNAWFIGYMFGEKSKIAVAVVLEDVDPGQTGGKAAAPLAGKIFKKAIDLGY